VEQFSGTIEAFLEGVKVANPFCWRSQMANRIPLTTICTLLAVITLTPIAHSQGVLPYPHAITDRSIHAETPMAPPAKNVLFNDRAFGSPMVRVTDPSTNFKLPGTFVRTEASGKANAWSFDTGKFYVLGAGELVLAFAFDPKTMTVSSLPNAGAGQGLLLPIRPGPTFSFVDSDLIYGTTNAAPLTISSYRFSTKALTPRDRHQDLWCAATARHGSLGCERRRRKSFAQ